MVVIRSLLYLAISVPREYIAAHRITVWPNLDSYSKQVYFWSDLTWPGLT